MMMKIRKLVLLFALGLMISASLSIVQASEETSTGTKGSPPTRTGKLYLPSNDRMADLAAGIEAARKSNRLLLVMMGANWCHDSRALASRIHKEPLSTLINEHFETLFVDVGYLEHGKDVISSLGIPIYYATPTVLIINPDNGEVINLDNRHLWAEAASLSMEDSVDYFQLFTNTDLSSLQSPPEPDENLSKLLVEIDSFEQEQADRLYLAYAVLSPMLHAYKEGNKDAFSQETWDEVRDFRYQVSADVDRLRAEARERVDAGETDIQLDYPEYPAFSWDS